MSTEFEDQLRRALRPVDPPDGFAARVMRALPERREPATVTPIATARVPVSTARALPRASLWRRFSTPTALAASLIVAVLVGQHVALERSRQEQDAGLAASRELMQALRVTSQKLDLAYQAVQEPPPATAGAQENRS
jgi:negative regulator of sigma E activity